MSCCCNKKHSFMEDSGRPAIGELSVTLKRIVFCMLYIQICTDVAEKPAESPPSRELESISVSDINKIQQDATVCRYLFTANLLYMFRVSIAPIIRSTQNCNCSLWYRSYHVTVQRPSSNVAECHVGGRSLHCYVI